MTREHSQASKGSGCRQCIGKQQHKNKQQQQQKSSLDPSVASNTAGDSGRRPTSASGGRSIPLCGSSLVQRRYEDDTYCDNYDNSHQLDSKEKTLSGLEESIDTNHNFGQAAATGNGTANELSSDDQNLDSKGSSDSDASRISSIALKKQLIFYQGKMKTVFVQVWPEMDRIPMHERHRLQEPMRKRYGKKSRQARLLKEFESAKRQAPFGRTSIPLLSRQMRDEAKVRLLSWYRPLTLKTTQRVCVPNDEEAFQLPRPRVNARSLIPWP